MSPFSKWSQLPSNPIVEFLGPSKVISSLISSLSRSVIISRPRLGDISAVVVLFISGSGFEAEIDQYFEDEDEQGYIREGEELEDIYEDDELSEMEGEELEKSLKLVMEDQMERMEQRKRDQELTSYETVMQGASASDWKKAESKRGLRYSSPPAARTEREHRQKAREAEDINKKIRKG